MRHWSWGSTYMTLGSLFAQKTPWQNVKHSKVPLTKGVHPLARGVNCANLWQKGQLCKPLEKGANHLKGPPLGKRDQTLGKRGQPLVKGINIRTKRNAHNWCLPQAVEEFSRTLARPELLESLSHGQDGPDGNSLTKDGATPWQKGNSLTKGVQAKLLDKRIAQLLEKRSVSHCLGCYQCCAKPKLLPKQRLVTSCQLLWLFTIW